MGRLNNIFSRLEKVFKNREERFYLMIINNTVVSRSGRSYVYLFPLGSYLTSPYVSFRKYDRIIFFAREIFYVFYFIKGFVC